MAFKSILTIVTDPQAAAHQIDAAVDIARRNDAHLEVLCVGIDRAPNGYYYAGAVPVVSEETFLQAQEDATAAAEAMRTRLGSEDIRWSVDSSIAQIGALASQVGLRARFSDLVVLARPYGDRTGPEAEAVLEAALFEGHAPVLVLPGNRAVGAFGTRIVLAWNQSDEAMNAARASLPLLKTAASVSVTVIDPPASGPERAEPGGLLTQYLVRHGVKAEVAVLAKTLPKVSQVLAQHARDTGADLIVMGAYGHSRFREAILGGATRNMLQDGDIPVLMAH